jgi:hypothetical protein
VLAGAILICGVVVWVVIIGADFGAATTVGVVGATGKLDIPPLNAVEGVAVA